MRRLLQVFLPISSLVLALASCFLSFVSRLQMPDLALPSRTLNIFFIVMALHKFLPRPILTVTSFFLSLPLTAQVFMYV